jgi:hypothetical protein
MKKFFVFENKDSSRAYVKALESASFDRATKINQADFILYDIENHFRRRDMKAEFIANRGPAFIYPHTPLTSYIWDGIYEPLPVACNFVAGEGQRAVMKAYGYASRVESCGFPRCEVLPFRPAKKLNLLFVPARPRRDKGRQARLDEGVLKFILDYHDIWDSVIVCRIAGQFPNLHNGDLGWHVITTNPKSSKSPADEMIERIDKADLMISVTTPAALGVARGCPTIMYGQDEPLETITGRRAKHFEQYRDIYAYPLSLERMTIDEVLRFSRSGASMVEKWKDAHIGGNFDANRFLEIVKEYI